MRKQLYCDIDSTINNHWVRIKRWALPSFPGSSIDSKAFSREEIMKDDVLPGALNAVEQFSKDWDIHFLTARNFPDAYSITEQWLTQKGFPYDTINVVKKSKDKPPFLVQRQVDLFVDDLSAGQEFGPSYINLYTSTIQDLQNKNIKFEIFKNNWAEILERYI